MKIKTDTVIVGTGVGGLFSALNLPKSMQIVMITKSDLEPLLRPVEAHPHQIEQGQLSLVQRGGRLLIELRRIDPVSYTHLGVHLIFFCDTTI